MKKIVLLIIICTGQAAIGQDWNTIETFTPAQTLQDVIPLNESTWIASSSLYSGTGLNMKRSNDNGETWTEENSGYTSQNFRSIASPDGVTTFAIANESVLITDNGTGDWETVDVPIDSHLRDIFFLNESDGWIGADAGIILKTTDGGETWIELETAGTAGGSINDIYFLDENVGFICGFNYFQRTVDGGLSWADIEAFEPAHEMYQLNEIHFEGFNTGWVCGDIGYIYKTEDGGITWTAQTSGTEVSLQGIAFVNENIGYACGFDGTILGTNDGGGNWSVSTTDTDEHIMAIDFNMSRGIAVSHSGQVLYMDLPSSTLEANDALSWNLYPNPCQEFIEISWSDSPAYTEMEIRDITGRLVMKSSQVLNQVNVADLKQGTYFLRLKIAGMWSSQPFVKG